MSESSTAEAQLTLNNPTSSIGEVDVAARPMRVAGKVALHAGLVLGALWLFVIALQLIKAGASGLRPVVEGLSADGVLGHFGFGWLGSYVGELTIASTLPVDGSSATTEPLTSVPSARGWSSWDCSITSRATRPAAARCPTCWPSGP